MEELLAELTDQTVTEKGDRGQVGVIAGSVDQAGPLPSLGRRYFGRGLT